MHKSFQWKRKSEIFDFRILQNNGVCLGHDNLKKLDAKSKTSIDLRDKNNKVTAEFFKKSASLIKHSSVIVREGATHPDVYFKQILRNYDYFNTEKHLQALRIPISVSTDSLNEVMRLSSFNLSLEI